MRRMLILAAGFLALPGCATSRSGGKLAKGPAYLPAITVPARVTADTYPEARDLYNALPAYAPSLAAFRGLLLEHLVQRAERELPREPATAFKTFLEAATLWHPSEVYQGPVQAPRLATLARQVYDRFSPHGDEERVIPALCVLLTLRPEDHALRTKFQEIERWVEETQQLVAGPAAKGAQLIKVLERTAKAWPSPFTLEALRRLYLERRLTLARALGEGSFRHLRHSFPSMLEGTHLQTGYRLARLYLRVGRPYDALTRLREASSEVDETELRRLLEAAIAPAANVQDQVRLAEHFEERDRDVALRVCEGATLRFPGAAVGFACQGRIAAALRHHSLAVTSLERAVELEPQERGFAEALAQQYQRRIFHLISREQLEQARREMERIEAFYRLAKRRFKAPLKPPLSRVHYAIGHGFYNAGKIPLATVAFEKAAAADPSPDPLVLLATIHLKRGDPRRALERLARAEQIPLGTPEERIFWQGRIEGLRGKALELEGPSEGSRASYRRSVEAWREWQALGLRSEARAEAYVYQAQSLYGLGERALAMDALDRAIDAQPDRKETYADVLALLTTHGHLPEALDALHRALGREEVSEYLKTYCSLWVIGLARRAGQEPDALALDHLRGLSGDAWYIRLAQLQLGQATFAELLREARTTGNRAELYFYWADRLVAEGKLEEARRLWTKVLETDMLAFFEYDMASFNLRQGPARVATRPLDRQQTP